LKMRVLLATLLLVASATTAMAAGPYVGASAGFSVFHDSDVTVPGFGSGEISYDLGAGLNVVAGYDAGDFRGEAEFGYKTADVEDDTTEATVTSYMLNGYYDFKGNAAVTPFVGLGIGLINGELEDGGDEVDDTVLGYQFSVGAAIKVASNVDLDLSYRYQSIIDDFTVSGVDISYGSSNLMAGVRLKF